MASKAIEMNVHIGPRISSKNERDATTTAPTASNIPITNRTALPFALMLHCITDCIWRHHSSRDYNDCMSELPPEALSDPMRPPSTSVEVHCLHCGQEYESYLIEWREEDRAAGKRMGFWCCPIPGCDGKGFCFDIFPTDPDYVDEESGEKIWHEDPPMVEGHESDCECVECEMAWAEEEAQFEREAQEYQRKVASGEIKPPPPMGEDDIPF
jgi:hypothetical protein